MKKLLLTAASAGLIAMAGPALAQPGGVPPGPGSPGMERESAFQRAEVASPGDPFRSPGATGTPQRSHLGAMHPGSMHDAVPHANVVGKTLRGSEGENIGEIEAVEGNNVIVSVGGFLSIGARDVAIPWSQVTMTGSGEDAELQTSLTRDQIREMPEHKRGTGATGTAPRGGAAR